MWAVRVYVRDAVSGPVWRASNAAMGRNGGASVSCHDASILHRCVFEWGRRGGGMAQCPAKAMSRRPSFEGRQTHTLFHSCTPSPLSQGHSYTHSFTQRNDTNDVMWLYSVCAVLRIFISPAFCLRSVLGACDRCGIWLWEMQNSRARIIAHQAFNN